MPVRPTTKAWTLRLPVVLSVSEGRARFVTVFGPLAVRKLTWSSAPEAVVFGR